MSQFRKRLLALLLPLLLVALFAAAGTIWLKRYTRHGELMRVPHLQGLTVDEARDMLANRRLSAVVIDSIHTDELPKGTIVDQDPVHYYQPGYLFLPFGVYSKKDIVKPKRDFIPSIVKYIQSKIEIIEPDHNRVRLRNAAVLDYDYLVIATGADIHPEETPGLAEHEWGKSIWLFARANEVRANA